LETLSEPGAIIRGFTSQIPKVDGGAPRQLTNLKGYGLQVRPSPDGAQIAFVGYEWNCGWRTAPAAGVREITTAWDRDVTSPFWAPDSKRIYFLSDVGQDFILPHIAPLA